MRAVDKGFDFGMILDPPRLDAARDVDAPGARLLSRGRHILRVKPPGEDEWSLALNLGGG